MHYNYKALQDFAKKVSQEQGLQMKVAKKGKSLQCYLTDQLQSNSDIELRLNIMIAIYDKGLHTTRFYDSDWDCGWKYLCMD